MCRILISSLVFAFSSLAIGVVPAMAQETPGKKIKVFIMSGQSGMAGFGDSTKFSDAMRKGSDRILIFEDGKWQPLADQVFHSGALGAHFRIDRRRELVCVFLVHQTAVQVQELKNKLVEQVNEMFPVPDSR